MGMESVYKLSMVLDMVDRMTGPMKSAQAAVGSLQGKMGETGTATGQMSGQLQKAENAVGRMQEKFRAAGEKITAAGEKIKSVGEGLTKSITTPAIAAGSALAGMTLAKGFARLTGIDDAKAKLNGLGHEAESVSQIMDSALASVKGTSYGMDGAATTAAGAVAAGVKQGKELTRYLSLTTDAAAIAKTEMSDMGSIFNKVQTSQKAYTDNLNQLADRGLPIYQWIGKEAGVTADKVKEMASKGEISSEMFLNAIEKNIGGAAKKMGESSFSAGISNIWASISRIGANFLDAGGKGGGFFSILKPLLSDFNNSLGVLEDKAKDLGAKFGAAFSQVITKIQEIKAKFDGLSPPMQNLILKGVGIGAAIILGIGPVLKVVGGVISGLGALTSAFSFIMSPVGLIVVAIVALVAAFGYLMATNSEFREKVVNVWNGVRDKITGIISGLQPRLSAMFDGAKDAMANLSPKIESGLNGVISGLKSTVSGLAPVFFNIFSAVIPVVKNLQQAFTGFFNGLKSGLQGGMGSANGFGAVFNMILGQIFPPLKMVLFLFQNFAPQIQGLVSALSAQLIPLFTTLGSTIGGVASAVIPAFQSVMASLIPVVGQLIGAITEIIGAVLPVLISLINQLMPFVVEIAQMIGEIVAALAPMIAQLVSSLLPVLTNIIQVVMNIVTSIMPAIVAILNVIMSVIRALIPVITSIIQVVINVVTTVMNVINPIISFIGLVISTIMAVITPIVTFIANIIATIVSVIGTIIGTVAGIFSAVSSIITNVWTNVSSFVSGVITGISTVISNLTGIVGSVFNGIYTTISSVIGRARDFVKGAIDKIRSFFNFSWSLPSLKLPHISISGSFSLKPPSVPKFGISWYKDGGIMTAPTIFGALGSTLLGGGEAGAEAILPLAELWKQMRQIIGDIIQGEGKEERGNIQQAGALFTSALTSKTVTAVKEKETKATTTKKETLRTEKGDIHIGQVSFTVDINKIKDLPMLYKLIDELKDAQNRTDDPIPAAE